MIYYLYFMRQGSYYYVRAANSMTNLARKLEKSKRYIWSISKTMFGIVAFATKNFKKLILATNSVSLIKLLPFFPPVYVGFRVFWAAFWPKRILFFQGKQVWKIVIIFSILTFLFVKYKSLFDGDSRSSFCKVEYVFIWLFIDRSIIY